MFKYILKTKVIRVVYRTFLNRTYLLENKEHFYKKNHKNKFENHKKGGKVRQYINEAID